MTSEGKWSINPNFLSKFFDDEKNTCGGQQLENASLVTINCIKRMYDYSKISYFSV